MTDTLPPEWDSRVRAELEADESLLWASQPLPVVPLHAALSAWPWVLFSVFWFGMAWFILTMTATMKHAQDQMDADFQKNFTGKFFEEDRERRAREREQIGPMDVVPWIGISFVSIVGVGLLLSPVWTILSRQRQHARTCYALTDRRALVWQPESNGTRLQQYTSANLGAMKRIERGESGDLVFEEFDTLATVSVADGSGGMRQETRAVRVQRGFLNVAEVREVERLIRENLQKNSPAR